MEINYNRDKYLSEFSIKTLNDRYLLKDETSPQDAFARAAKAFSECDTDSQLESHGHRRARARDGGTCGGAKGRISNRGAKVAPGPEFVFAG